MRVNILCCFLLTLLLFLDIGRFTHASITSMPVKYNLTVVHRHAAPFSAMEFDRKNNIFYLTISETSVVKIIGGTLTNVLEDDYPKNVGAYGSTFYFTSSLGVFTWDGIASSGSIQIQSGSPSVDGPLAGATALSPTFIRVSPITGDIYFSEECRVRRISGNVVHAFAGVNVLPCPVSSGDNSTALSANLNRPRSIAITPENEVLIMDNNFLRKVLVNGIITTIAQVESSSSTVAAGDNGDIYIAMTGKIEKISNNNLGEKITIAGGGSTTIGPTFTHSDNPTMFTINPRDIVMGNNNSFYFIDARVLFKMTPYCPSGYVLSNDNMVCYPICFGEIATSQSVCSSNGSCTAPNVCSCSSGYTGDKCQTPICYGFLANDTTNVCYGKGSCIAKDNCVCQEYYSGSSCNVTTCFGTANTNQGVCSGRGSCKLYNSCNCSQSYYYGQNCENTYCYSIASTDSSVCSSNGVCQDYDQCSCSSQWYGNYCNVTECFSVLSNSSNVCSGAGICNLPNNCTCNDGYNGTNCENFDCFGVSVNSGQSACLNNGTCSGPGACSCLPTYYGKTCEISTCYGILSNDSTVCSSNGKCNMLDTCECNTNYYGSNCSFPICFERNYDDIDVCSGRGRCTRADTCECDAGYSGNNCELFICYGIDSDKSTVCSSHGTCANPDLCQCRNGYRGHNCQYFELVMDVKSAVLSSAVASELSAYAPATAVSCQNIFSSTDLSYLGSSDTVRCIWNKNMFKIYLGYGHFLYENMTMNINGNGKNFTLQVTLTSVIQDSSSYGATVLSPQLASVPKTQLFLRSFTPASFQGFRNTSLVWTCSGQSCSTGSTISQLFARMNDRPVVLIPSDLLITGTRFSVNITSKNWIGTTVTSSRVDIIFDPTSPYFELASDNSANQFTCSGFDCIIEVNSFVGSPTRVSFDSPFNALNTAPGDNVFRFMNRYSVAGSTTPTILRGFYEGQMNIQTSSPNALRFSMSYTNFEEVQIVLLNTEKQWHSEKSLTISPVFVDPMIDYLSSDINFSWSCSSSSSRDGGYVTYTCPPTQTRNLIIPISILRNLERPYHSFAVSVTISDSKIATTEKSGIVHVVTADIPDIVFDLVPPVYPPSRSLVLNAVISSSTNIGNVVWKVTNGNLLNENVLSQSTRLSLDGNNIKSTLVIDRSYLLQGDSYTFTVSATNDAGIGTASISTVIDVAPRITCQAYDSNNNNIIAYSSDVVIDCISLSDYSIASYHVDVFFNSTRIMTVSKTMKKSFVVKLPYGPNGNVRLEIRAINKVGSVSATSLNLKVGLPTQLLGNSLADRIIFVNSEFESIKSTLTRLDSVSTMHSMLLLITQQNSLTDFTDILITSKSTLTTLLTNMLARLSILAGISSNAADKLAPVFIPFTNDVYKLLAVVSSSTVSSDTALLNWVKYFVSSFNDVKTFYRTPIVSTIYDSKHLTEIESLIDIGSNFISADQFTPFYKETALISRLVNDVTNNTTPSSTIVDSSGTETRFDFIDILSQLNSKTITFVNYPSISIFFPSNIHRFLSSFSGSGITLSSTVSTTTRSSQIVSPVVDISLFTSAGSSISVSGLSGDLIQINFGSLTQPKANFTNLNYTCRFLNTTSSEWSQSGVSSSVSVLSDDGQTVTFSLTCFTSHLTSFSVISAPIPEIPTKPRDNTGVIVGAVLGTLIPLFLIAVITVVVVIVVFVLYKRKKSLETSRVQNVELVNKNVSSVYISDFPSEESTHFKQLVSVSSGSTSTDPLSRYTDMVKIGQGAFGSVFRGVDTKQAGKLKAIKVIRFNSVGDLNNMLKEGTMLMNIDHPHVLKVNEFIIDKDNILCIDTDFCEDGDLTKLTLSAEPVAEPIIKQVIYQMSSALSFIHTKLKIIHRDVKPHNIFLKELTDFSVQTVLADFGLAKQDQNNSMNSYAGTPLYMSPELALGGKYNYNTDTWSLGVVAYQLITKDITTALSHLCLTGDSEDTRKRIRAKLDEAGQYSESLKEVVLSMLEKDASSRPFPQELLDLPYFQDYRPKKKKNNIFRSSSAGEEDMYH